MDARERRLRPRRRGAADRFAPRRDAAHPLGSRRRRRSERAGHDDRPARVHRPRRRARGTRGRAARKSVMNVCRYVDRPDLRERRDELNLFPTYMNHNAMGWKYWGRLYTDFPDFQLAVVDGDELVGEVHALTLPVEAEQLPRGWDETFERGMEA